MTRITLPEKVRHERLRELEIDLDVTELYYWSTKDKRAREALNKLREILIVAIHDLRYKGGEHEYAEDN